ncbi:Chemotaxis response regulator protein-glutamate methylesterase CheB [hydrothermal vent metagenome]|uniref:protein-glutamate methylesterase n=1 Tax=hydrothermal vent metagenome TaxID=652676 RepID=A0A3B0UQM3_9ZZZZ
MVKIYRSSILGVVLTGMGGDGALGAVKIADAGGSVFAQDEKSSIVWGMPGAAMEAGACVEALDLEKLGHRIGNLLLVKGKKDE